ncbi:Two-component sensor histidine kinase, contains HisKA and HATPase domains [Dyadobacter sp. SG02]|uniref:tetratricopeptide repeat-containing sensor histidine kinase n=1 Tax=Dyadobacter sp. SG02 TaxID=1855291 RepID=UPI0008B761F7|nr:histidine kinase dimerization/phosphoacceptor domain -containing protein [Dyadobacter sp. SG02]SEJ59882.1 Two-component sensor histidine kinase, contains HisKA and HATPase domains [Dyadobacter sp. SG02]
MSRSCYIAISLLLSAYHFEVKASFLFPRLTRSFADSAALALPGAKADTNKIILLLKLSTFYIYKPGEAKADMDSASTHLVSALSLSNRLGYKKGQIMTLLTWSILFSETGDRPRGVRITKKAIGLSAAGGETLLSAIAWFYLGETYPQSNEGLIEKAKCFWQAKALFKKAGDKESEIDMLGRIADIHYKQGNYAKALSEFENVLALFRSINGPLHLTYNMLTEVSNCLGNYQESIKYGHAAIETAQQANDTIFIGFFYSKLASAYYDLGQWEPGILYLQKALNVFSSQHETMMVLSTGNGICRGMVNMGHAGKAIAFYNDLVEKNPPNNIFAKLTVAKTYGHCYMGIKNYGLAEKSYNTIISLLKSVKNEDIDFVDIYKDIGNYYLTIREYDKARHYLSEALHINHRNGTVRLVSQLHAMLFKVDSAQGNYLSAIRHQQQFKSLSDSIFNEAKSSKIATLQIQYDSKEKEQNIALLNRQNVIQQASIRQKELERNVTIGGAFMLLLFSGLIYNQYRTKKRNNEQLTLQQIDIRQKNSALLNLVEEKEWLLKEVHHRVKNNLQTVMGLLEMQLAHPTQSLITVIRNSQRRVFAMSLIHQKLYQSDDVRIVKMNLYLKELVEYLQDSFVVDKAIRFELDLDPVDLKVARAIPLALILNEAITNALKYAFTDRNEGRIVVAMKKKPDGQVHLSISDDGVGLPKDLNWLNINSLGMKLMTGLSDDINARFTIESNQGTTISLVLPPEQPEAR